MIEEKRLAVLPTFLAASLLFHSLVSLSGLLLLFGAWCGGRMVVKQSRLLALAAYFSQSQCMALFFILVLCKEAGFMTNYELKCRNQI